MRITVSKVHIESTKLVNIYESSLGLYRRYCIVTMKCLQYILCNCKRHCSHGTLIYRTFWENLVSYFDFKHLQ